VHWKPRPPNSTPPHQHTSCLQSSHNHDKGVKNPLRAQVLALIDTATSACQSQPVKDKRIARLLLVLQLAAAGVGMQFFTHADKLPPVGPRQLLGECARALPPHDAFGLVWAWRRRNGGWSRHNTELLYEGLAVAPPPTVRGRSVFRAVLEVELLASLPLQPPPVKYLEALLNGLAASAEDGSLDLLPAPRRVELLLAVGEQRAWSSLLQELESWPRLMTALVKLPLVEKRAKPGQLLRSLLALMMLRFRYDYSLPLR